MISHACACFGTPSIAERELEFVNARLLPRSQLAGNTWLVANFRALACGS
jgi:hypothetical protein